MDSAKRTKVLATLGPASASEATLTRMVESGLNAVRVNTSHADERTAREYAALVRKVEDATKRKLALVFDLQGPKIRLDGVIEGGIEVETGGRLTIATETADGSPAPTPSAAPAVVTTEYAPLAVELATGETVLIGDGEVRLLVLETSDGRVECEVLEGGRIKPRKGITRPGRSFSADSLQDRDYEFIRLGCELAVDYFAVSFVRRASDLEMARGAVRSCGKQIPLIAKIEQPEAIDNLDEVIEASDGVMVARGDLGLFLPVEQVPLIQKRIIARCNEFARPVITATQMLESMIENDHPTRAEVSDVANAILDGTDAVMLSEETATGAWPVEVIEMMSRIARATEESVPEYSE
ncbi:MAG: pyruvate kinase, partial [bacterium]